MTTLLLIPYHIPTENHYDRKATNPLSCVNTNRRSLIAELNEYQPKKRISLNTDIVISEFGWEGLWKFISGAFFGILMLFYGIFSTEEDKKDTIIGSIIYLAFVGGIFYFIPIIFFP